ncbi:MAG TPA: hypothetical protein VJ741_09605 [Solirubrobacteraceae bacterium]|nr:hypothetical protein [Solirubrobacteraceae bacterium]
MRPPDLIRPATTPRRRIGRIRRWLHAGAPPASRAESACTILGPTHPLARAIETAAGTAKQWRACAAILTGAIIAKTEGHSWATALAVSAGIILLALTALLAALQQLVRDRATALIADDETVPITTVQRQRQRLLTRRRSKTLARTLNTMVRQATTPPKIRTTGTRPLFDPAVIAGVSGDVRAVIARLQMEHTHARGVALTEQLITDGGSPLYGHDEERLREELHRVRYVLDG